MIYATRETPDYLNRLWANRPDYTCDIVAIGGGMSWLHHLSPSVDTLYVVDEGKGQLDYIQTILSEIRESKTFGEFVWLQRARQKDIGYQAHWHEQFLERETFNWNFGSYYFEEPTYPTLRAILNNIKIHYVNQRIETFDFSIPSDARNLNVLVGNADHSQYTGDDKIVRRIMATRKGGAMFVSWNRELKLFSVNAPHAAVLQKLYRHTWNRNVIELDSWSGHAFNQNELGAQEYHRIKLEDAVFHRGWHDTALWHISAKDCPIDEVTKFVEAVTPDYQQVIILEHSERCDLGELLKRLSKYQETYRFHLEWAGEDNRCFILVLERT